MKYNVCENVEILLQYVYNNVCTNEEMTRRNTM